METCNSALIYPYIWDVLVLQDLLVQVLQGCFAGWNNYVEMCLYFGRVNSVYSEICYFKAYFLTCIDVNVYRT